MQEARYGKKSQAGSDAPLTAVLVGNSDWLLLWLQKTKPSGDARRKIDVAGIARLALLAKKSRGEHTLVLQH